MVKAPVMGYHPATAISLIRQPPALRLAAALGRKQVAPHTSAEKIPAILPHPAAAGEIIP